MLADQTFKLKQELDKRPQHPSESLKQFIYVVSEFYDSIGEPVPDAEKAARVRCQVHLTSQDLTANMAFANLDEISKGCWTSNRTSMTLPLPHLTISANWTAGIKPGFHWGFISAVTQQPWPLFPYQCASHRTGGNSHFILRQCLPLTTPTSPLQDCVPTSEWTPVNQHSVQQDSQPQPPVQLDPHLAGT